MAGTIPETHATTVDQLDPPNNLSHIFYLRSPLRDLETTDPHGRPLHHISEHLFIRRVELQQLNELNGWALAGVSGAANNLHASCLLL